MHSEWNWLTCVWHCKILLSHFLLKQQIGSPILKVRWNIYSFISNALRKACRHVESRRRIVLVVNNGQHDTCHLKLLCRCTLSSKLYVEYKLLISITVNICFFEGWNFHHCEWGGVVLYVMLSGERAFESQSKVEVGAVKNSFWMYIIGMKLSESIY